MKNKILLLIATSFGYFLLLNAPSVMAAGNTVTWSGVDCTGGAQNCDWSDVNNWVGNAAPVAGDNLVFDNSSETADQVIVDDIPSTTVFGDLTFQGSTNYSFLIVPYNDISNENDSVLAVNGNITDNIVSGSNQSTSGIYGSFSNSSSTPTYTINDAFQFGDGPTGDSLVGSPSPSVALAATVNFASTTATFSGTSDNTDIINYGQITGSEGINLDLSTNGDFQQLNSSPGYTGTIDIVSGTLVLSPYLSPATMPDMFSGASITVESGAGLVFQDPSATSVNITEPITVAGTGTANCSNAGSSTNCGSIFADIDPSSALTFTGAITLSANSQFNTTGQVSISGSFSGAFSLGTPYTGTIVVAASSNTTNTPNGTYSAPSGGNGGEGGGTSSTSTTDKGKIPGTPDTGVSLTSTNSLLTALGTMICGVSLLIIVEISKNSNKKASSRR